MSNAESKAQIQAKLDTALNDAWVAQTMIASVLATVGPTVVSKETAQRNYEGWGIEMEETDEGILMFLKQKDGKDDSDDK